MTETVLQFLMQHWRLVLLIWLLSSAIGAMPVPNGGPVTGTWWYKWLYGALHTAAGNLPQVLTTLFPRVVAWAAKRFLGISVPK